MFSRSCLTIRGEVRIETPVVQAGIRHIRHISTMVNTKAKLIVNPQTMKITSDLEMPKLPEVMTTEGRTNLFVHKRLGNKPFRKVVPTWMEDVLPQLEIIGKNKTTEDFQYKTTLKIGNRYITVDETTKKVVLGDQPTKWIVIPAINNRTVITLRHPTLGYVYIKDNELCISRTKRSHFFIENHSIGLRLKALVPINFTSVPEDLTRIQTPVMELVRMLQRNQIAPEIVERGLAWKLVSHLNFSNLKLIQRKIIKIKTNNKRKVTVINSQFSLCNFRLTQQKD